MLLCEAGYEHGTHEEGIARIRARTPSIQEAVASVTQLYCELYKISPADINCGMCEDFAADICSLTSGAKSYWGDEVVGRYHPDAPAYGAHCVVEYQGRYYDSEAWEGVLDVADIPCIRLALAQRRERSQVCSQDKTVKTK